MEITVAIAVISLFVGYVLGITKKVDLKVNVYVAEGKKEDEEKYKDYPSFVIGSPEHKIFIAEKLRKEKEDGV